MDPQAEWLETDGEMGFASGTVSGRRTRRYHGWLLVNTPAGRVMLVNGADIWLETRSGTFGLSTQVYRGGIVEPRGEEFLTEFQHRPWPTWRFETPRGHVLTQECFLLKGASTVVLRWRLLAGEGPAQLHVKPLLSVRDYHGSQHKNDDFRFDTKIADDCIRWQPYADRPALLARSNGRYEHAPAWFENFEYGRETERGLDDLEDLAVPGEFHFDDLSDEALLIFAAENNDQTSKTENHTDDRLPVLVSHWEEQEKGRRRALGDPLLQAADAYLVRRGDSRTIIAGYPWFTDWGRDTFIAIRGLCFATGRLDLAEDILCSWAETVSQGMLPNRFPDLGDPPEYNSVDASLWYVVAVGEFVVECDRQFRKLSAETKARLKTAITDILNGYRQGTRFGIHMDDDGLIAAGEPGVQLTWMDAKAGDWVVTPRIGKPVEIQALWINALGVGYDLLSGGEAIFELAWKSFETRFWNPSRNGLYDVVDCDHQADTVDPAVRPNQIFAVGGLPLTLLDHDKARAVVETVEEQLWTPLGLRSLSPEDPNYRRRYLGDVWERDGAYHQGTVWCWLIGPFVEAWIRVRGGTESARIEARERFLKPLDAHLKTAGLGHISEIADGDPPHTPRGCPFQAWSLGEYLRLEELVCGQDKGAL